MKVIKYSTEHLVCYRVDTEYHIYEKEDNTCPVCIYIDRTNMKIDGNKVIENHEEDYKYFFELGEIVQTLWDME